MIPSIRITSALLLASTEELAAVDRRMLRSIGVRNLKVMTSGTQAARLLCGEGESPLRLKPDAVFCADALADMRGIDFLELLRLHPRTERLPVLLITSGNDTEMVRRSAAAGKAAVLGRPYSTVSLRTVLFALLNAPAATLLPAARNLLAEGAFDAALQQYEQSTGKTLAPEEHFARGLACLQQRAWDDALKAFQQAMQEISLRGDAELGMAAAWKGKGNERKYREYMARAAESFALAEKWNRARSTYVRLLRDDPAAANPFLSAVERLVREQRFDAAAMALAEGHDVTSSSALHTMLAKTFLASDAPERQVHQLQRALGRTALAALSAGISTSVRQHMNAQTRLMRERRASHAEQRRSSATSDALRQATAQDNTPAQNSAAAQRSTGLPELHMPNSRERLHTKASDSGKKGIELRDLPAEDNLPELSELPHMAGTADRTEAPASAKRQAAQQARNPEPRAQRETRGLREREKRNALRDPSARLRLTPPVEIITSPPADDTLQPAAPHSGTDRLAPLTESQSRSSLFMSFPMLNEVFSVIKTTWQLTRRQ